MLIFIRLLLINLSFWWFISSATANEPFNSQTLESIFQAEAAKAPYLPNISFLIEASGVSYAHLPDLYVVPGSVIKLIIAALYLEIFGLEQRFQTSLFYKNASTYQLFFAGDPSLKEEDVVRLLNHIPLEEKHLNLEIATSMAAFPEQSPDWMIEDFPSSYIGPISPYQLNDGRLKFKLTTLQKDGVLLPSVEMPVAYPYQYVNQGSMQYLESQWVKEKDGLQLRFEGALPLENHVFEGSISALSSKAYLERLIEQWATQKGREVKVIFLPKKIIVPEGKKIAIHESYDLKLLLKESLASSNNAFYDLLFFKIAQEGLDVDFMTWELASEKVKENLKKFIPAIDWNAWNVRDGAGLSFKNSMRGKDLMSFLQWIQKSKWLPVWKEILPKPGSGTMKRKFIGLENHLMGKSGLLSGVETFAGFLYFESQVSASSEPIFWPVVLAVNHGFDPMFKKFTWHESLLKNIVHGTFYKGN